MTALRAVHPTVLVALTITAAIGGGCGRRDAVRPPAFAPPRLIVLITIDTLRADRLGAYGSRAGLTPNLDRFAQSAVQFTAAVTQVPLTLPAHATILTGLHPARHGIRTNDGFTLANVPTLAEALHRRGYATGGFIGGYPLRASSGLSRGFDRYDDDFLKRSTAVERRADDVVEAAAAWIGDHASQPVFAWLHLFDPHSPYTPPEPFATAYAKAPYDGEIAYTDAAIGRLFDRLSRAGFTAAAAVFIVADHGESLGEHGERTHGTFLYDATVHVPLLVKVPSAPARVVDAPVEAADIAPTIAELAGTTLPSVDGRSVLPLIARGGGDPDRPAYAESYYQNVLLGWSPLRAVRTRTWKFIEAPRPELYDLQNDPAERTNHVNDRGALAAGLQRTLPPLDDSRSATLPTPAMGDAAERLRGLGYVGGATTPTPRTRAVDPKDRVEVWAALEDGIDRTERDPGAARSFFVRALELDPSNGLAMKYLGDISFQAGQLDQARDEYRRALAAGFAHPDVFVNLASIAERQGRTDEARAALSQAVKSMPTDADAWNRLGLLEARQNRIEAAREAFTRAIAAAPDRAEPYYNLAIIERGSGDEAAAAGHLRQAIERNPSYPEAHYALATGYLAAGDPQRALDGYRAALAARPRYPEALFGAARAELDLNRAADARRDYEEFVRIAPPEYARQAAAAREMIKRLQNR
ncbi:MAG TPA: sulfatase-like hydrolase/transferase [Vicinamibacterales bacterium]